MKTIVLCGGGTAGHIMPNIALLPELRIKFDKIYYMGGKDSLEEKTAKKNNIEFFHTDLIKFHRKNLLNNIKIPYVLHQGVSQAKRILSDIKPDIIFCKGGYASLPAAIAGKKLNIPVICHESDMSLGLANRIISRFAVAIFTSFKETCGKGNIIYTGVPIREELLKGDRDKVIQSLNLSVKPIILVIGGSMGAKAINKVVIEAAPDLCDKFSLLHISGDKEIEFHHKNYRNIVFADNIGDYYAAADIVISRAGATACAEIARLAKRAILIPLPKGSSRGDQEENAEYYSRLLGTKVIKQSELNKESLINTINERISRPSPKMEIDAASNVEIVNLIYKYCLR